MASVTVRGMVSNFAARNADPNAAAKRATLAADLTDLDDHLAARRAWRNRPDEWERADALNAAIAEHHGAQSPALLTLDAWVGESEAGPMGEGSWWAGGPLDDGPAFLLFITRLTGR